MTDEMNILLITAASIGFIHTITGPDHYVPFIVLSKARHWSVVRTCVITVLCGLGHVLSSVVLGFVGIGLGFAVSELEGVESSRGDIAGWALVAFGFVYMIWGIRQAYRNRPHTHWHDHGSGVAHEHVHTHHESHSHVHPSESRTLTPWVLFIIFVLGPCEPLIPILMYPAAQSSMSGLIMVTSVFGFVTIATMVATVVIAMKGIEILPMARVQRYTHALAGGALLVCGVAIQFLGL